MSDPKPTELVTLSLVLHEVRRGNERVTRMEERFDDLVGQVEEISGRVARNSSAVKNVSNSDMSQEAKLAETIVWRSKADERLSTIEKKTDEQTEMLRTLTSEVSTGIRRVLAHPMTAALAVAVGGALLGVLKGCQP